VAAFLNQYSVLFLAIPLALLIAYLLQKKQTWLLRGLAVALLLGGVILLPILFPGTSEQTPAEIETILASAETPVLLEFYSNY
jgi:4-hydroxybenzoate polyprenyltransferase